MPAASAMRAHQGVSADLSRGGQFIKRHRRSLIAVIVVAALVGFFVFVLPQISGLSGTLRRLRHADPWWIGLAVVFEAVSLGGYILLFRTVFSCHGVKIGWRESYQINMAGTVASKLFAAAGAGGLALTAWALRASGLEPRVIVRRMLGFQLMLYAVFASALMILGPALRIGLLSGPAPWTLTIVPAVLAAGAIAVTLSLPPLSAGVERWAAARARSSTWLGRQLSRLAGAPRALDEATGIVLELVRERRFGILGAPVYWGLDIATLWASLHAFGTPPPAAAIVMAYFIGQLANALPLPGGVGGVEGGTIGALLAFGAQGGLAVLGVLAYRLISFWLPTLPGAVAYLRLRRTVSRWRRNPAHDEPEAAATKGPVRAGTCRESTM